MLPTEVVVVWVHGFDLLRTKSRNEVPEYPAVNKSICDMFREGKFKEDASWMKQACDKQGL